MSDPQREIWSSDALLLTPEEAARVLRVGRTTVYALLKAGEARRQESYAALRRMPPPVQANRSVLLHGDLTPAEQVERLAKVVTGCGQKPRLAQIRFLGHGGRLGQLERLAGGIG